ncbi:MAG: 4-carboxy-4-hydroxy-2-oxoadipate aldolase/oxaloacetate decarboxylase [Alphaproteobacteria bacterium]
MADKGDDFPRPDAALLEAVAAYPSATLHEAMGRKGALPAAIKPVAPGMALAGPVVTVKTKALNNINIHRAIYLARPGDVLMVDVDGGYEGGYFGEIMAHAAKTRGLGGLVIDGCVRDADLLQEIGFPVFARGFAIRGTLKEEGGFINEPITIGDVAVNPGDVAVGDRDGVVVVPGGGLAQAAAASQAREDKEAGVINQLKDGARTIDIYGWSER